MPLVARGKGGLEEIHGSGALFSWEEFR